MKKAVLLTLSLGFISTQSWGWNPVIYGEDHRQEVYEADPKFQKLALSTATLISAFDISLSSTESGKFEVRQTTLKEWMEMVASSEPPEEEVTPPPISTIPLPSKRKKEIQGSGFPLCEGERFSHQPNPGQCSGFLIAPDLLVTASHCAEIENFCDQYRWVFDFKLDRRNGEAGKNVSPENVYSCKKVVSSSLNSSLDLDYALVQLDRKVLGREPLEMQVEKSIAVGEKVVVIGSPSGLPLKVTGGASVRDSDHPFFFKANLDTYEGNSGSAVFNAETGLVEGILVSGETDFVPNTKLMCIESKRCSDNECDGEGISRINSIPEISLRGMLHEAASSGDEQTLTRLLKLNLWIDVPSSNGMTALMRACKHPVASIMDSLIKAGADIDLTDVNENTALHHLAVNLSEKNADALDLLVKAGASLEAKNSLGETPLQTAAKWLNLTAMKLLITAGADKNVVNSAGESILVPFKNINDQQSVDELLALGVAEGNKPPTQVSAAK